MNDISLSKYDNADMQLNEIKYDRLFLSDEILYQLKFEMHVYATEREMKSKYSAMMKVLKTNQSDWSKPIIQLPNLCLTEHFFKGFDFDDDYGSFTLITLINRYKIVNKYVEHIEVSKNPLYIYGLSGIGKSFIIYQMAAKLMVMDDRFRVIYVNQSNCCLISYMLQILKTIILHDCDQNKQFENEFSYFCLQKEFIEIYKFMKSDVMNYDEPALIIRLILHIKSFYSNKFNIELIFLFDHIELILSKIELRKQYDLLVLIGMNFKTVYCESAINKQIKLLEMPNLIKLSFIKPTDQDFNLTPVPNKFSFEEIKLMRCLYTNALKQIKTVSDLEHVESITGGLPFELHLFFNNEKANRFDEMIEQYYENFFHDYRFSIMSIDRWYHDLSEMNKMHALENLARCILKKSIKKEHSDLYDKRLFTLKNKNDEYHLETFSSMEINAILSFYDNHLRKIFSSQQIVHEKNVKPFIKHSISLEIISNPNFSIEFEVDVYGKNIKEILTMSNFKVNYLIGLRAFVTSLKDFVCVQQNRLFVPLCENYPGYDLLYYDGSRNRFCCIKIVSEKNPIDKVIENDDPSHYDHSDFLTVESETKPNQRLAKTIDEWLRYLPNGVQFFEFVMLNRDDLTEQINKVDLDNRRRNRLSQLNIIYFDTLANVKLLSQVSYFYNRCQ